MSTPQFDSVRALKGLDKVSPVAFNPYKKLSQINGCLPAIVDIDGDEDFDYITNLNVIGSNLTLNLNNSAERGAPLGDIDYEIIDKCYGGISEYSEELTVNSPCYFPEVYKKKHSATKTLCFFDNDADGDYQPWNARYLNGQIIISADYYYQIILDSDNPNINNTKTGSVIIVY